MKKTLLTIIAALSISLSFAENEISEKGSGLDKDQTAGIASLNIIKLNISSLIFKSISLQYERGLTSKMSVALCFRSTPGSALPFRAIIENQIKAGGNNVEVSRFLKNTTMGGFAFTPEFRYYLGKGNGRGLYIAPFLRYERFNIKSVYPFKNEQDITTDIDFKGSYKTLGAGILIGTQFQLSNRITLDWWILGPYFTAPRINLDAEGYNLSTEDLEELKHQLEDTKIEIGSFKIEASVNDEKTTLKSRGNLAAIRGFGLCLGIKF